MKRGLLLCLVCLIGLELSAQEKFTLNGYIKDSLSGETLIGANLTIRSEGKGIVSNQYGFYSITLVKGTYTLLCSFIGYQPKEITIDFTENRQQNILLLPNSAVINNVTVIGRKRDNNVKTAQMGKFELSVNTAKALPAFLGEVDILKTLQLLPGVRNAGEGKCGFLCSWWRARPKFNIDR